MRDYTEPTEFTLREVWFDYLGDQYQGQGVMRWRPDEGFHIHAPLRRLGPRAKERVEIGKVRVLDASDRRTIWMRPDGFDWAIAPQAPLYDRLDVLTEERLSIRVGRVVFCKSVGWAPEQEGWSGEALYATGENLLLPDRVERETKIGGEWVQRQDRRAGLAYDEPGVCKMRGRLLDDDGHLHLDWFLPLSRWSKSDGWEWAEAVREALSMATGRSIRLLQREVRRGRTYYTERRLVRPVEELQPLCLFRDGCRMPSKETILRLAVFLQEKGEHVTTCRRILEQALDAARQETWQGKELLLSTILEAALRTIDGHPFRLGETTKDWDIGASMRAFRSRFLTPKWTQACDRALAARKNLRHRNAHPDWLVGHGGSLSPAAANAAADDMIFLSHFYGYMILALANFPNLEPVFPGPHGTWKPSITIGG